MFISESEGRLFTTETADAQKAGIGAALRPWMALVLGQEVVEAYLVFARDSEVTVDEGSEEHGPRLGLLLGVITINSVNDSTDSFILIDDTHRWGLSDDHAELAGGFAQNYGRNRTRFIIASSKVLEMPEHTGAQGINDEAA